MCLVSRQLGFVISPKFSYYLVPRSTTSPLILSSLVPEHPDILRFASPPPPLSLFPFSSFFFSPSHRVIRAPFSPQDPATSLATLQSTRINDRFSNCMFSLPPRSSLPFNSRSFIQTRVRMRGEPFRGFEFRSNRSTSRRDGRGYNTFI